MDSRRWANAPTDSPAVPGRTHAPSSSGPRCDSAADIAAATRAGSRTPNAAAIPHISAAAGAGGKRAREDARQPSAEPRVRERALEPPTTGVTHAPSHRFIREESSQRPGNRFGILVGDEKSRVSIDDDVGRSVVARTETGDTRAHGLQIHEPEALPATWHGEHRGMAKHRAERRVGQEAGEVHVSPDANCRSLRTQPLDVIPTAHHYEIRVRYLRLYARPGKDELVVPLVSLGAAHAPHNDHGVRAV